MPPDSLAANAVGSTFGTVGRRFKSFCLSLHDRHSSVVERQYQDSTTFVAGADDNLRRSGCHTLANQQGHRVGRGFRTGFADRTQEIALIEHLLVGERPRMQRAEHRGFQSRLSGFKSHRGYQCEQVPCGQVRDDILYRITCYHLLPVYSFGRWALR